MLTLGITVVMPKIRPPRPPRKKFLASDSTELERDFERLNTDNPLDSEILTNNEDLAETGADIAGEVPPTSEEPGNTPRDERIGCRYHTGRVMHRVSTPTLGLACFLLDVDQLSS